MVLGYSLAKECSNSWAMSLRYENARFLGYPDSQMTK